jgi:predicted MPP superfamily phosphohydrolase
MRYWGAYLTSYGMLVLFFFVVSLPLAAVVRSVAKRILYRSRSKPAAPDSGALEATWPSPVFDSRLPRPVAISRRQALNAVTAVAPIIAISGSFRGISNGARLADVPRIVVRSANLPSALHGLSILQLSDLHLGVSRQAKDLDAFIDSLGHRGVRPDLVLFTGDLADDLSQIVPAIQAAQRLKPRLGIHSSLGNHEYIHGVAESRRQYERGHANLLIESGAPIRVGGSTLYLAGTDDPLSMKSDIGQFMQRTVERSLRDKPKDAFSILLSHRPEGFTHAANAGVDLTLSGHTHGGQIGFNGKSAFEPLFPDGYLWGIYKQGASTLYTTSGWGHWFPFRLGCPAEAPLVILERSSVESEV